MPQAQREVPVQAGGRGQIKNFTGVDDPYEPSVNPELAIEAIEESIARIFPG